MKIFACFIKQSRLLFPARAHWADNCFQIWRGVDESILWLSFAQQNSKRASNLPIYRRSDDHRYWIHLIPFFLSFMYLHTHLPTRHVCLVHMYIMYIHVHKRWLTAVKKIKPESTANAASSRGSIHQIGRLIGLPDLESIWWISSNRNLRTRSDWVKFKFVIMTLKCPKGENIVHST
jgi:hypothetical protein